MDNVRLTCNQAAAFLGISRCTLRQWDAAGQLPAVWTRATLAAYVRPLTAREVAALLSISISSVWRYVAAGELPPRETWREATIAPLREHAQQLRRRAGPERNPRSARYVTGRHRFAR